LVQSKVKVQDDKSDLLVQSKVNNDLGHGGHLALVDGIYPTPLLFLTKLIHISNQTDNTFMAKNTE
jgi:L-fucose mutarotase/ribose pyranase (RbsD/FucU family)